jgi:hypothetical protein
MFQFSTRCFFQDLSINKQFDMLSNYSPITPEKIRGFVFDNDLPVSVEAVTDIPAENAF